MKNRLDDPNLMAGGNVRSILKVTVLKTLSETDIFGSRPPGVKTVEKICPLLQKGDTFYAEDKGGKAPADFPCPRAWHNLYEEALTLQLGGNFPEFAEGSCIVSCASGLHPVIFRLERVNADA